HTRLKARFPPGPDQISKEDTSVLRRVLTDTTKLTRIKDTMLRSLKLKPVSQHLLNPLTQGVQQNNGAEHLGSLVVRLARLWYDNRPGILEVRWPITDPKTSISYRKNDITSRGTASDAFPVTPCNMVRTRRGPVRGGLECFEKFS